ncbi:MULTISPECIES: sigma-70 family RNA polymerase sigma factor [Aphanothece]|uniref:sigma-70 family RNA polymerase sigma factor n=1 Tax=Aphanothece TaxID=1121 RepID=UPI00398565FC
MSHASTTNDPVRLYLREIGRVELLSQEQEITLARLVQTRERLLLQQGDGELTGWAERCGLSVAELRLSLHRGRRAKEKMLQANLRLVVAVAKKYQRRGLDLLDLVQEGTLGLERAVERYDPRRGFRFSTYAYWWIRQGITRGLASQSRTIRLPVHITETINRVRLAQHQLSGRLGRTPSLSELAAAVGLEEERLRRTLTHIPRPVSLEGRVSGGSTETALGDLLEDSHATPEQQLTRQQLHADLEALLEQLSGREATVIRQRFGLDDDTPRTLAEIGENLQLSRERIRQIESRALLKLRQPQNRCRVLDYLGSLDER